MRIKKGLISEMKIVLVIVVIVILFLFSGKLYAGIKKSNDRDTCKTSVLAQSVIMSVPGGENVVQPDCKTFNVDFYDNRVEINDERASVYDSRQESTVKSFDGLTDEIVNQVVAEELRWCWYQFLEGQRSLFSLGLVFSGGGHSCFLCSEINFDSSVTNNQFTGFYEFIKKESMLSSGTTYYDYIAEQSRLSSLWYNQDENNNPWEEYAAGFSGWLGSGIQLRLGECGNLIDFAVGAKREPITTDIVFDKTQKYVVFFVREGESSKVRKLAGEGKGQDCNDETYFAYVIPSQELKEQCSGIQRGSVK